MINLLNIDHKNVKKGIELTKMNKKFLKMLLILRKVQDL